MTWLNENGLRLSTKSSAIIFRGRKIVVLTDDLRISNEMIPWREKIKYLGVTLDEKLSGRGEVDRIMVKCSKGLNILRCLVGTSWWGDPKSLMLIFNSLIRSHIDYASPVWIASNKSVIKKVENI